MDKARLSSKGQLIIPKQFREELKLKPGDEFRVSVQDGFLILQPAARALEGWQKWRGKLADRQDSNQ